MRLDGWTNPLACLDVPPPCCSAAAAVLQEGSLSHPTSPPCNHGRPAACLFLAPPAGRRARATAAAASTACARWRTWRWRRRAASRAAGGRGDGPLPAWHLTWGLRDCTLSATVTHSDTRTHGFIALSVLQRPHCNAPRFNDLHELVAAHTSLRIYNTQCDGMLHDALKAAAGYVCRCGGWGGAAGRAQPRVVGGFLPAQ